MSIEIRLKSLEARKAAKNGVFLVEVFSNGVASYVTAKGKKKVFNSANEAKAELYRKFEDPCIIVLDWGVLQ